MAPPPQLTFDEQPIDIAVGDTVLTSLIRAGIHPTGGGCLCCGGDCPHCVATVDGISYVRTCQVKAAPGMVIASHPRDAEPPLRFTPVSSPTHAIEYRRADMVVIGGGPSGLASADTARREGRTTVIFDAAAGEEVIGVYDGPLVVARTATGMVQVECDEIVVATGAAELQPVCPGSELAGILTQRAAEELYAAGVDLGRVVAVGEPPQSFPTVQAAGELVRFEGINGRVSAVVVASAEGEQIHPCDTAVVGLGLYPRDALARMGAGLPVTLAGQAGTAPTIPACPRAGVICPCSDVTMDQMEAVWDRGFREMELIKRATLAGTGTCQGAACTPYLRSFLQERGAELQPAFTARPVARQLTMGEIAAGSHHHPIPRTPLHDEHLRLGAQMDRIGGWWRPWTYGDTPAEYQAVRERVSLGDVGTLGKMIIGGPDAAETLQRIYPTDVSTIRPGRSRYVLMLNERGYVFDDGLICRRPDDTFMLTFTSGGASMAEMWIRDWAASFGHDIRLLNQTMSLGAINVTGPRAGEMLERVADTPLPGYMGHADVEIAGVPCWVVRLSFTGELSYELHHPADRSVELWRALLAAGAEFTILPHGLQALEQLRLEKGHILIGVDSDYDSTPRRLDHEWAVNLNKGDFIGRDAILRTNDIPLDKMLVGLTTPGPTAPLEGAVIWNEADYSGYVTSSFWSPTLQKGVMLGWVSLVDGAVPPSLTIAGLDAAVTPLPFYDPGGGRARG
jgi:glycine cleavage system aminomethyltransferase T